MGEVADIGGVARRMKTGITEAGDIGRRRDRGLAAEIKTRIASDLGRGPGVPMPGKKITEAVVWTAVTRLVNAVGAMNGERTERMLTADVNSNFFLRSLQRKTKLEQRHG